MKKDTQKDLMLANIQSIAYIRQGARIHGNELGVDRWTERLREAINISFMLQMLTDDEIYAAIQAGEADRIKEE